MRHRFHRAYEQHPNATLFAIGAPIGIITYLAVHLLVPYSHWPTMSTAGTLGATAALLMAPGLLYVIVYLPFQHPRQAARTLLRTATLRILTAAAVAGACSAAIVATALTHP